MTGEIRFANEGTTKSERQIHTPGTFAKENLLYVQEIGRLKSLTPHKCIREGMNSFLFMIVLSGRGSLTVEGVEYKISAGDCAFIDCMGHYEHISSEDEAWRLGWIHFNGKPAKAYHELFLKSNGRKTVFRIKDTDEWNSRLGEIFELQKNRSIYSELRSGELLLRLVNRIIHSASPAEGEDAHELANSLREYLNIHFVEEGILKESEEKYSMDEKGLSAVFEGVYGIGIEDYIESRRINEVKSMLRFSLDTIDEIAKEAGIGSEEKLDTIFRKWEGVSPQEYRSKWAGWIR